MDKSWMQIENRWKNPAYEQGVKEFLDFAFANKEPQSKILCPCIKCNNFYDQTREVMEDHLFIRGIVKGYVRWIHHGEDFGHSSSDDDCEANYNEDEVENADMREMLHDIASGHIGHDWGGREESSTQGPDVPKGKVDSFYRLLNDAEQELYPGCKKYSMLSFIVKLLHFKTMNRWSDKSFNMLLELIKDALPIGETLPGSYYEAKKIIRDLGLDYVKIHACVYDCVLFWKEYEDCDTCPKCGTSRWKFEGSKKIPQKVLRYFPGENLPMSWSQAMRNKMLLGMDGGMQPEIRDRIMMVEGNLERAVDPLPKEFRERAMKDKEKMKQLHSESQVEGANHVTEEEICAQVLGEKSSYVRGRGAGVKPSSSAYNQLYKVELDELRRRAEQAEKENSEIKQQNSEIKEQNTVMQAEMQEMKIMLKKMMEHIGGNMSPPS